MCSTVLHPSHWTLNRTIAQHWDRHNAPVANRSTAEPRHYPFVVVPDYVFVYRLLEFREAAELFFVSVEHLLLHLREQVLRLAVVKAVSFS